MKYIIYVILVIILTLFCLGLFLLPIYFAFTRSPLALLFMLGTTPGAIWLWIAGFAMIALIASFNE